MATTVIPQSFGLAAQSGRDMASYFNQRRQEEIMKQDRILSIAHHIFERRRAEKKEKSAKEKQRQKTTLAAGLALAGAGIGGFLGAGGLAMGLPGVVGPNISGGLIGAGVGGQIGTSLGSAVSGIPQGVVGNIAAPLASLGQFQLGQEQRGEDIGAVSSGIEMMDRALKQRQQEMGMVPTPTETIDALQDEQDPEMLRSLIMQFLNMGQVM